MPYYGMTPNDLYNMGPTRLGGVARHLNLKKQFAAAVQQHEWEMQKQASQQKGNNMAAAIGQGTYTPTYQDMGVQAPQTSQQSPMAQPDQGASMMAGGAPIGQDMGQPQYAPGTIHPSTKIGMNGVDPNQVSDIADAIASGDQPPDLGRLYKYAGPVKAALAKKGFNLTRATRDWLAITKTIAGLNSTQQVRMRQALDSVELSLPILTDLNSQLKRSGLRDVNYITVNAALRGVGPQRDIATKYITQINVMKDELAQGFMGGGVPTDRAFKLAEDILQPMYGKEQFDASLIQLGYNLKIRKQAISSTISPLTIGGEVNNPSLTGQTQQDPEYQKYLQAIGQ